MNADQVIEGIGKAVVAAQPVQEYCLLGFWGVTWWPLCMSKSEWAAWVQGIAVCITLFYPFILSMISRRKEKAVMNLIIKGYCEKVDKIEDYLFNGYSVLGYESPFIEVIELISSCVKFIKDNRPVVDLNSAKYDAIFKSKIIEFYRLIDLLSDELVISKTRFQDDFSNKNILPELLRAKFQGLQIKSTIKSIFDGV